MSQQYDLIVIGAGPGGYVGAIRAAQLGMRVACIDKRGVAGGTCLNVGCIPSKALLHSTHKYAEARDHYSSHGIHFEGLRLDLGVLMARKNKIVKDLTQGINFLFKKNKIDFFAGEATLQTPRDVQVTLTNGELLHLNGPRIIIATGSVPTPLPGIHVDEHRVLSSTGALDLQEVPRSLIIVGGGYIGLEMGSVWARLGTQVTVVEYADRITPAMDKEVSATLQRILEKQGLQFKLSTKVLQVQNQQSYVQAVVESITSGTQEQLQADYLLACAGRKPFVQGLGLEAVGVRINEREQILVNEHFETSVPGIYAIGDVIPGPMLAHKAEEEGVACVEMIMGQKPHVNYGAIPGVVYTNPEVATVGKTEEELKGAGTPYVVGKFPFQANSRARANGDTEGFVKILSHATTDEVLGVHIIHSEAGTMIAEAVLAMEYRASSEDIARTCHAHPTVNEAVKEAALSALGRVIHM